MARGNMEFILSSRVQIYISLVCCAHLFDIDFNTKR